MAVGRRVSYVFTLVFAVAEIQGPAHVLVGVDVKTGRIKVRRLVDPPGMDPQAHQQRAALALSGGSVSMAFGGLYDDCGDYHGWVVASRTDGAGALLTYQVPTTREGGISKYWRISCMKTLIIIPTYNEVENLRPLLKEIVSYAPETHVLIVDDNSPDGTGKLADEIHNKNPQVHVLHRSGKLGLGTAYIAGFKYAIKHDYDAVFEIDADFSHDPHYLPDLLKEIEHADLVIGSRYVSGGSTPNWSIVRRLISNSGNIFARFMLGIPVHDCTAGFRCYRRKVLQSIDLDTIQSHGYAFQVELTYRVTRQGFKIVEIPIIFMDRRVGKSKMSRKIIIEAFAYVLRTRFNKQAPAQTSAILQSNEQTPTTRRHCADSDSDQLAHRSRIERTW